MNNEATRQPFSLGRIAAQFLRGLRRLWYLILLLALLGGAFMGYRSWTSYTPVYSASATFSVYTVNENQSGISTFNFAVAEQMAKTFPYILTSGVLSDLVKTDMGLDKLPAISVSSVPEANMITLTVKGGDAQLCYDVLQSVIRNYPQVAEFVVGPTYMNIVDETGVPQEPDNGRSWTGAAKKGVVVGAAIGLLIALIYGYTKSTVMGREDIQSRSNVRYLGTLPAVAVKKRSRQDPRALTVSETQDRNYKEAFRALAVRLDKQLRDRERKTLMVCSAASGEGKTTVAYNMALSFAKLGRRVLLLDCDLRNPSLNAITESAEKTGLSELLSGTLSLENAVHTTENENLGIIYAGSGGANEELMQGSGLSELMREFKESYDYIVMDTPPCSLLTDAEDLAEVSDAAIMVIKQNYASRSSVIESMTRLSESGTAVVGYILNAFSGRSGGRGGYGYGYGYGYAYGYGYGYGYGESDDKESDGK